MTERIGVLIAEDQDLVRASLRELLDSDPSIVVTGEARDGQEAVAAADRVRPDVVLMDIRMPGMDGLTATELICERRPATRVLILTTFDLDEYVYRALRLGASGFLLKNAPPAETLRAVHVVHAGNAMLAPEVTRRLIADVSARVDRRQPDLARFDVLTERERDVVAAILRGMSNEEIAAELFLSRATVKTYLSRLFLKLGVRDRTQLVILGYECGLVEQLRRPGFPSARPGRRRR
ncbi:response regulator transcription factor [Micromonospora sp. C28SCA-DRY-2]|uniref:response regulator transcription factor n=1 Tax=Micromonospora sp. C28SCA-DRY-2 TaxID=3059522 RepID=UPI002676B81C|nr:response regulator transcription factor [Micromonospora sp. C28SCA-DRY-2]MDO3700257.1 response regulator transcription factor [Micromonospora sp. C28SCA-DRY-2]